MFKLKHITKNRQGFTLIELILFMGMFSFIMLVLMQIFTSLVDKQSEVQSVSAVESDRSFILARLNYDITRASNITIPANPGDQGSTLALNISGQTSTYSLIDGNIILTNEDGTDRLNSHKVTIPILNFERLGNAGGKNVIKLNYAVESLIDRPQGRELQTIDTTIGTR